PALRRGPARRGAPGVRGLDPRDGLPPARQLVQHRQEGRARRAPVLHRAADAASPADRMMTTPDELSCVPRAIPRREHDNSGGAGADSLTVAGLEPFSSCDWPGHLVATVFLQ